MLFCQRRGAAKHDPEDVVVRRSQVVERRDVPSGDDEQMKRRLRVDVLEGDHVLVVVDEMAGDLPSDDLAEQAVAHRR